MGNKSSQLTKDELEDYKVSVPYINVIKINRDLTYLTETEILHIFGRFKNFDPVRISRDKMTRIPDSEVERLPELQNNPFVKRICRVFSSNQDRRLSFEDFLEMASAFSESAPIKVKCNYAFRIFDFDDDGVLSVDDLAEVIRKLVGGDGQLTDQEMEVLLDKILDEIDLDKDGTISLGEFEHAMLKSPDFLGSFTLRL